MPLASHGGNTRVDLLLPKYPRTFFPFPRNVDQKVSHSKPVDQQTLRTAVYTWSF